MERRSGWPLLLATVRSERRGVAAGVSFGLGWTAAKVAVPALTRQAVDRGIIANEPGALLRWSLAIGAAGVLSAAFTGLRRYQAFSIAHRGEAGLRVRLFAHLQRLHFAFHDQAQTGQLMARAATDLQQVNGFLVMIPITVSNAVTIAAVCVLLVLSNAGLALLALGALPLINFAARRFSQRIHPVSMELQGELSALASVVEETVTGIRVVKGFGAEAERARRLRIRGDAVYDRAIEAARIRARFTPIIDFLPAVGLVAVLWYGGHQVLQGRLTVGELVAFNAYVLMLVAPLRMTGFLIAQAQRAVAASARIDEVFSTEPAITEPAHPRRLPQGSGLGEVRFADVRFGYMSGGEQPVLEGLDLVVRPGEAVALVGPTGCGKTTVARLIPRFYDVEGGAVLLDGIDVRELELRSLRQAVGIVFEDTFLFSDTVGANISFADPDASDDAIERAARLAGAHDFITALPDGYRSVIGERGFSLSGGQRQRLALARAILADPRVLILDDATSSVDPTKEHEIRDALTEVMRDRTTIVIAHRPATIALADRVVLLDRGRVVAEGAHDELLRTTPKYRAVLAQADRGAIDEGVTS